MPSRRCRFGQYPEPCEPGIHHLANFQAQGTCVDWPKQQCGKGSTCYCIAVNKIGFQIETEGQCFSLMRGMIYLLKTGGRYKWVDNWLLSYTTWGTDEPKHNYGCVYMDVDTKWKTAPCTNTHYSLCKRSPGQAILQFSSPVEYAAASMEGYPCHFFFRCSSH